MCFSAKASFITSAALAGTGYYTFAQVQKKEQTAFALIPFIFSLQQFFEGMIWLIHGGYINSGFLKSFSYLFLFFALVIWPTWIPLSVYFLEQNKLKKNFLKLFTCVGLIFSAFMLFLIFSYGATAKVECSHISYYPISTNYDEFWPRFVAVCYIFITIFPFIWSSRRSLNIFAAFVSLSALISYFYWYEYFISVWCFFAALLSLLIYAIIRWQNFRNSFEEIISNYKDN